jgi:alpha-glucosidase
MQWDSSRHAGFTAAAEPWLPVSDDAATRNMATQVEDPGSVLNLYRRLLTYRKGSPELQLGAYERIEAPAGVYAYKRGNGVLVALNFTDETIDLDFAGTVAVSTRDDDASPEVLRPHEGLIIEV